MSEWITRFQTEPTTDLRKIYVDEPESGEIVCRVLGTYDVKVQEDRARLIASAPTLKQQRNDLLDACRNGLTTLAIISMPRLDNNVATDTDLLKILAESLKAAIAKCEA